MQITNMEKELTEKTIFWPILRLDKKNLTLDICY